MDSNDFNVPQKVRSLVQQILPQEIIVLFDWVQIHNKKKQKIETQLIVISKFRLFTFEESKKSIKKKPNRNGSFLTLKQLISFDKRHIKFGFQDFELDCYCDRADTIVEKTMKNYLRITQGIPHERFIDFSCIPSGRLSFFQIDDSQAGGFISTYEAWCNYLNIQPNIDLINYIEEKILKNEDERKKKTLDLHKLDRAGEILSDEGTSQALFQALSNNLHFEGVIITKIPHKNFFTNASIGIRTNCRLEKLIMSGMGVSEGIETLGVAIQNNPRIPLTFLDLSLNKITDKAIETGLSRGIASLSMGLVSLDLSFCQMTNKAIQILFISITENKKNRNLRYLNLSNNSFGKQGSEAFAQWLETTHNDNVLTLLNLSNCALDVGIVALAIAKYQSAHTLKAVDFSGNKFDKRAYIHVATMMKESKTLKELNISNTLPTSDGCAAILNEILANSTLSNIVLSISANDIGAQGAKILSSTFQKNENSQVLEEIIIDDNNLKAEGVNDILNALTKIQSLKRISISRNVPKAKNSINLVFPFAQIMQKQSLEYLRVCGDSKFYLGSSLEQFFKNTTGKSNLRAIDITGNQAGDSALRALALHAAHPNSKLVLINFDLNKTTIANFSEFARIFESNSNLSFLAWPKFDAQSILKDAPKRNTLELQSKLKQFKSLFYEGNKKNNLKLPVISVDLKRFENQDPFLIHSHDFFRCQLESDDDPNNSNSQVVQSSLSLLSNKKM